VQNLKSRSKSRVLRRTPGGVIRVHYEKLRLYKARCSICGTLLNGVPRDYNVIRMGPKSSKRPERPYGGQICHRCLEMLLKVSIRSTG
jgi:large subunit ribosomal protein L34e